ncbi:MAG: carboxypeptidase regulatory-like domain-containing protein [Gemmatimonadaceae bacterium]
MRNGDERLAWRSLWTGTCACALLSALMAATVLAQDVGTGNIAGVIRDSLGTKIAGAEVVLRGSPVRIESDDRGEFKLGKVPAGELTLAVRRIGFRPDTVRLMVLAGQTVPLDMIMHRLPVQLQPVLVFGRRNLTGRMAGFWARKDQGIGHFVTRDEIERRNPPNVTDMFRMIPGARVESRGPGRTIVRFRGSQCAPLTWLDGTPLFAGEFDLDAISPRSLEGIEIYSGSSSVPTEFLGTRGISSSCGTIILWSRQGELRPKKRKGMSAAQEIAAMVDSKSVFTADQVDVPAHQDSTKRAIPVYPDSLYEAALPGRVVAEFVVDITGEVNMDSFNAVSTTHPAFVESVRRALKDAVFYPAVRQGYPVRQVVHQPFNFFPDSAILKRRR